MEKVQKPAVRPLFKSVCSGYNVRKLLETGIEGKCMKEKSKKQALPGSGAPARRAKHALTKNGQMSDSMPTVAFLTLSGGLQDAYSYCVRGKVFANAQTGNIVLMSSHFFAGDGWGGLRYLIPLAAFTCGVFAAEQIRARFRGMQALHWRQLVVGAEILLLFLAGFLPAELDFAANALVSFACAMQVQAFRKLHGNAYASTMCIGNLRSGVSAFSAYLRTHEPAPLRQACDYFGVIVLFAVGAGVGSVLAGIAGQKAIWFSCALLLVSFTLMFIREEEIERAEKQATAEQAVQNERPAPPKAPH